MQYVPDYEKSINVGFISRRQINGVINYARSKFQVSIHLLTMKRSFDHGFRDTVGIVPDSRSCST